MDLWDSLGGMMEVELTSAEPELALDKITERDIELLCIHRKDPLTYRFTLHRRDFPALRKLSEKRNETLKVKRRRGIFWIGKRLARRPVFLAGALLFLLLVFYLPSRVLFIRVEGNTSVPDRRILEAASESGIRFGASRREVRSEKMKNTLLSAVPELQWAGVNTSGCTATISVRERAQTEITGQAHEVTRIVASRDGYILSGTVTSGNALFQVGQAVTEGQVLVSGYTDCGICIRAEASEAEILAETRRSLRVITPTSGLKRVSETGETKKYSLLIGKKRINLWNDSRNSTPHCGRMYEEYYVTLPGGFRLPIALCAETYTNYEVQPYEVSQADAEDALRRFAEDYLSGLMAAGTILKRTEEAALENGRYLLVGEYVCAEMIGKVQREQIGEQYGKDS